MNLSWLNLVCVWTSGFRPFAVRARLDLRILRCRARFHYAPEFHACCTCLKGHAIGGAGMPVLLAPAELS